ncbi:MAG TPA: hypothetical protein VN249_10035 [Prolixibacteraceae bacterium]|nr:hypothetical protein [Prolixibacteraceae bacterium]
MKTLLLILFLTVWISLESQAQKETKANQPQAKQDTTSAVDLLGEMNESTPGKSALLPDKIMFTQRIFWGEKGLMRTFNAFELTPEKRQAELRVRRTMLVSHQILGFITLGGMVAQGFVGAKLYNATGSDYERLKETHEAIATGIEIGYFTTAGLSLFAPPKMVNERKGYSSIKLHKGLAMIHFTGMITTMVLAGQLEDNPDLKPWHRAAAYTTFGAYAASMIVIKF